MTVSFENKPAHDPKHRANRTQPLSAFTQELDRTELSGPAPNPNPKNVHPTTTGLVSSAGPNQQQKETVEMANAKESLAQLASITGFVGACLVDSNSGMMLGSHGGGDVNLELAAAGNTEVVRAKRSVMNMLKLNDVIEDILITLGKQYHLIRPIAAKDGLFVYLVLDRAKSNLAMGRHALTEVEKSLSV
jgi:hypothetical protein